MSDLADPRAAGPSPLRAAGAIIPFPVARRARGAGAAGDTGRILLFTGVRYERLPEAAQVLEAAAFEPPAVGASKGLCRRARRPRRAAPARRRQPS